MVAFVRLMAYLTSIKWQGEEKEEGGGRRANGYRELYKIYGSTSSGIGFGGADAHTYLCKCVQIEKKLTHYSDFVCELRNV